MVSFELCVFPWSFWQITGMGRLLLCFISLAGYGFSVNTVTSGRKTRVGMNLVLKGPSPLPESIFEELVPSPVLSRTSSFPCRCYVAGSWILWAGNQGRYICTLHVVHTTSQEKKYITYQEENALKSLKTRTVRCLYRRRVCDQREGKYWLMLSLHRVNLFYEASNSILKHRPAHAHTLNWGI